uniref:AP2/ERF domain-containing protein n=1 Tax=Chromera velia CCMP2878 TaxID=1169474 RepID=A0A0G4GST0_9ALVE|eukprot:Cvel_23231.t1-p1 / transcript=Cvel_23231.t1 / gene=Cvel_23231 / organism=Chromera_velia_CCMP2878 / gene_product=hypothetical protein / transcript_product=hypothetical protein / location=Cvel_scaffold2371:7862-13113(+) / protein_length=1479 / sequence_SO=supercontig / SO=protein_coding / is_pseudo=false
MSGTTPAPPALLSEGEDPHHADGDGTKENDNGDEQPKSPQSAVRGVFWNRATDSWTAKWVESGGTIRKRSFSANKYGHGEAQKLAEETRLGRDRERELKRDKNKTTLAKRLASEEADAFPSLPDPFAGSSASPSPQQALMPVSMSPLKDQTAIKGSSAQAINSSLMRGEIGLHADKGGGAFFGFPSPAVLGPNSLLPIPREKQKESRSAQESVEKEGEGEADQYNSNSIKELDSVAQRISPVSLPPSSKGPVQKMPSTGEGCEIPPSGVLSFAASSLPLPPLPGLPLAATSSEGPGGEREGGTNQTGIADAANSILGGGISMNGNGAALGVGVGGVPGDGMRIGSPTYPPGGLDGFNLLSAAAALAAGGISFPGPDSLLTPSVDLSKTACTTNPVADASHGKAVSSNNTLDISRQKQVSARGGSNSETKGVSSAQGGDAPAPKGAAPLLIPQLRQLSLLAALPAPNQTNQHHPTQMQKFTNKKQQPFSVPSRQPSVPLQTPNPTQSNKDTPSRNNLQPPHTLAPPSQTAVPTLASRLGVGGPSASKTPNNFPLSAQQDANRHTLIQPHTNSNHMRADTLAVGGSGGGAGVPMCAYTALAARPHPRAEGEQEAHSRCLHIPHQSNVRGVFWNRKSKSWVTKFWDRGEVTIRSFSTNKYGYNKARQLAEALRTEHDRKQAKQRAESRNGGAQRASSAHGQRLILSRKNSCNSNASASNGYGLSARGGGRASNRLSGSSSSSVGTEMDGGAVGRLHQSSFASSIGREAVSSGTQVGKTVSGSSSVFSLAPLGLPILPLGSSAGASAECLQLSLQGLQLLAAGGHASVPSSSYGGKLSDSRGVRERDALGGAHLERSSQKRQRGHSQQQQHHAIHSSLVGGSGSGKEDPSSIERGLPLFGLITDTTSSTSAAAAASSPAKSWHLKQHRSSSQQHQDNADHPNSHSGNQTRDGILIAATAPTPRILFCPANGSKFEHLRTLGFGVSSAAFSPDVCLDLWAEEEEKVDPVVSQQKDNEKEAEEKRKNDEKEREEEGKICSEEKEKSGPSSEDIGEVVGEEDVFGRGEKAPTLPLPSVECAELQEKKEDSSHPPLPIPLRASASTSATSAGSLSCTGGSTTASAACTGGAAHSSSSLLLKEFREGETENGERKTKGQGNGEAKSDSVGGTVSRKPSDSSCVSVPSSNSNESFHLHSRDTNESGEEGERDLRGESEDTDDQRPAKAQKSDELMEYVPSTQTCDCSSSHSKQKKTAERYRNLIAPLADLTTTRKETSKRLERLRSILFARERGKEAKSMREALQRRMTRREKRDKIRWNDKGLMQAEKKHENEPFRSFKVASPFQSPVSFVRHKEGTEAFLPMKESSDDMSMPLSVSWAEGGQSGFPSLSVSLALSPPTALQPGTTQAQFEKEKEGEGKLDNSSAAAAEVPPLSLFPVSPLGGLPSPLEGLLCRPGDEFAGGRFDLDMHVRMHVQMQLQMHKQQQQQQ